MLLCVFQIVHAISDINKHNQELVRKYRKEMALRKKFHNELVELKGMHEDIMAPYFHPLFQNRGVLKQHYYSFDVILS